MPGAPPPAATGAAGSHRSIPGHEPPPAAILAELLLELERRYDAWREQGLESLYEDLAARDFLRGRRITVDGTAGTAQLIARDGRLEVDIGSGRVMLESGEVLFER